MSRLLSLDRLVGIRYKRLADIEHEVRVLEIQPAKRLEDAVVSRLITVCPTKANFDIIGLSSLDGDPETTEIVYIDNKPVKITAHRAEALRTIRELFLPASPEQKRRPSLAAREASRTKTRLPQKLRRLLGKPKQKVYVWLDAICINQSDLKEANHRRETMRMVYQSAKSVLGWLGPKIDVTDLGLTVFSQIDECMPRFWGDPGDSDEHPEDYAPTHAWAVGIQNLWDKGEDGSLPFFKPHWVGANDFLYRPYLQKQWILQEITMASYPAFLIGDRIVPWRTVMRVVRITEDFKDNESDQFPSEYRSGVADLPLGSCYELLREMKERNQSLTTLYESDGKDWGIWGCGKPPMMPHSRQPLAWQQGI